jgi:hypothetical protein
MLVFGLGLGLGFIGCAIPDNGQIDRDIAFVSIKLPIQEDRSAYTDALISQTTAYHLVFTTGGATGGREVFNETFPANQSSIDIELTPGSHVFTLNAMKDKEILGTGSETVTLVKGDNTVEIVLIPVNNNRLV